MTPPSGLRVEEVTAAGDLGRFRAEWDALAERAPARRVVRDLPLDHGLAGHLTGRTALSPSSSCARGEALVGLAPLLDDREGEHGLPPLPGDPGEPPRPALLAAGGGRSGPGGGGDAGPPRGHPPRLPDAAAAAATPRRRWWTPSKGADPSSLVRQKDATPIIRLEGDWEAYLASRPRHLRHELARKRKRLETEWDAKWVNVADAAGAERAMTDVLRIERNSWKDREGTSLVSEPAAAAFYTRMARNCAARGWLRLELLYLDGAAGGPPPGRGAPRHLLRPQDLLRRGLPGLVAGDRPLPARHPQGLRGRPRHLRLPGGRLPLEERTGQRRPGPRRRLRLRRLRLALPLGPGPGGPRQAVPARTGRRPWWPCAAGSSTGPAEAPKPGSRPAAQSPARQGVEEGPDRPVLALAVEAGLGNHLLAGPAPQVVPLGEGVQGVGPARRRCGSSGTWWAG